MIYERFTAYGLRYSQPVAVWLILICPGALFVDPLLFPARQERPMIRIDRASASGCRDSPSKRSPWTWLRENSSACSALPGAGKTPDPGNRGRTRAAVRRPGWPSPAGTSPGLPPEKRGAWASSTRDCALFPHLTVRGKHPLRACATANARAKAPAVSYAELLARMGIGHLEDRSVTHLSGGGETAGRPGPRALTVSPEVLLLDEPPLRPGPQFSAKRFATCFAPFTGKPASPCSW